MSGVLGYVLGYEDGQSSAETSRRNREIVDLVFYGQRTVQVDQSYLNQLHQPVEKHRGDAVYNFNKVEQFYAEALDWKEAAFHFKATTEALEAQLSALQATLAERDAALDRSTEALAQERAAHQITRDEKQGFNLFRLMATWLINAHIAGRAERPAFVEMRDMAEDVTDAIERGEIFWGYRDEPEKKERLRALLNALLAK